ncbi:hypothetical protein B0H16DRAFT_1446946 [Mycena metata]|uniref:DUF829-domain-containing protein n=1 Tax=Mycena metata TaxID=1033252 RepID=A0AAD7KDR4_9AGAR|nr:hypothetical protein B0H16DRAFT_1446946 [Mycena metata]
MFRQSCADSAKKERSESARTSSQSACEPDADIKLHKLGQDLHISYGHRARSSSKDPRVIILFGWMNAPPRILSKYAVKHRLHWPSSDIVIVQSHPALMFALQEKRNATLKPLVAYLVSTIYRQRGSVPNGIFLHVISNGGSFQLVTLARVLESVLPSEQLTTNHGTSISLAALFDSTPGIGEYAALYATFTVGVKSPVLKTMMTPGVMLIYALGRLRRAIFSEPSIFTLLHTHLGAQGLLPLADGYAPRLYIYSEDDQLMPFAAVEQHIERLKANPSSNVTVEKFSGSQHVQHERHDRERYWNAVYALWDRALPVRAKL